jgi:DNA-binding MarR family transcriptional regulator
VTVDAQLEEIHLAIAALQRLSELFQKRRSQLAEGVGLTEHQWGVLEQISTEHFMPSMFARQRESSAAAVSKTIRQLIEKNLVEVSTSASDGRQRNYQLTQRGRRVMSKLRKSRQGVIEQVWQQLDLAQLKNFNLFASDLANRLEDLVSRRA